MGNWSERDLAYFAGIVDGEGCFCLHNQKTHRYSSQLQVGNTDMRLMEWIQSRFGGSVGRDIHRGARNKEIWRWAAHADTLDVLLPALLPFLVIKRQQAELFLTYRKTLPPKVRTHRATAKTPDAVKHERQRIHTELSLLNRRGVA